MYASSSMTTPPTTPCLKAWPPAARSWPAPLGSPTASSRRISACSVPLHPNAVVGLIRRPDTVAAAGCAAREKVLRNHKIDRYLDHRTGMFGKVFPVLSAETG